MTTKQRQLSYLLGALGLVLVLFFVIMRPEESGVNTGQPQLSQPASGSRNPLGDRNRTGSLPMPPESLATEPFSGREDRNKSEREVAQPLLRGILVVPNPADKAPKIRASVRRVADECLLKLSGGYETPAIIASAEPVFDDEIPLRYSIPVADRGTYEVSVSVAGAMGSLRYSQRTAEVATKDLSLLPGISIECISDLDVVARAEAFGHEFSIQHIQGGQLLKLQQVMLAPAVVDIATQDGQRYRLEVATAAMRFVLPGPSSSPVRIVDGATGSPVEGATVRCKSLVASQGTLTTEFVSAASGLVTLPSLTGSMVSISRPGYGTRQIGYSPKLPSFECDREGVPLIRIVKQALYRGRIQCSDPEWAHDRQILAYATGASAPMFAARSKADGSFELVELLPAASLDLREDIGLLLVVLPSRSLPALVREVTLALAASDGIVILVDASERIDTTLRIVNAASKRYIDDFRATLDYRIEHRDSSIIEPLASFLSSESGSCRLVFMRSEVSSLNVMAVGYETATVPVESIDRSGTVVVQMQPEASAVRVLVTDESGQPVADVSLEFRTPAGAGSILSTTNRNGASVFPGDYAEASVSIAHAGYFPLFSQPAPVYSRPEAFVLPVQRVRIVELSLTTRDGDPIDDANVVWVRRSNGRAFIERCIPWRPSARIPLPSDRDGNWSAIVVAASITPLELTNAVLESMSPSRPAVLEPGTTVKLTGSVPDQTIGLRLLAAHPLIDADAQATNGYGISVSGSSGKSMELCPGAWIMTFDSADSGRRVERILRIEPRQTIVVSLDE